MSHEACQREWPWVEACRPHRVARGHVVTERVLLQILTENGPWVLLVFYLLWRDVQKEQALRQLLHKNTEILVEMTTMIRERLTR